MKEPAEQLLKNLSVILVGKPLLGRFTMFSPCVKNNSHCAPLESQICRKCFKKLFSG